MDQRSNLEKALWDKIGPPLYYCADCLRAVKVKPVEGSEPIITRPCGPECAEQIIAPRKAICYGKGGASMTTKARIGWMKLASLLTRRTVI
jgi:hypothetical protein